MKLPDELVERAAKAIASHHGIKPEIWELPEWKGDRLPWLRDARAALEAALSEGGTTQRFCLYHGATAVSDPEVSWCRIADRSNPTAADWCKVVDALVIPLDSTEHETVTNRPAKDS